MDNFLLCLNAILPLLLLMLLGYGLRRSGMISHEGFSGEQLFHNSTSKR